MQQSFSFADNKKPVRMLSTFHSAQELPSGRPKIVNNYNKNMGGVDTTDAIMKAGLKIRRVPEKQNIQTYTM
jgi:hypothetical protein